MSSVSSVSLPDGGGGCLDVYVCLGAHEILEILVLKEESSDLDHHGTRASSKASKGAKEA